MAANHPELPAHAPEGRARARAATRSSSSLPRRPRSRHFSSATLRQAGSGSSTSSPGTAAPGPHSSRRGRRPIAFTGSTGGGKEIQRRLAGTGKRLTLELGGKAANIVFDDARRPGGRGNRQRHLLQPGHVCWAGSRLFVRSIYERWWPSLSADYHTARRRPARQDSDVGAINSAAQLEKSRARRLGVEEGAEIYQPPCVLPENLLVRADRVHERRAELPDRAEDLRPCPLRPHVPHPRGSAGRRTTRRTGLSAGV